MFNTILNWSIAAILASFTIMPVSLNRQSAPAVEPNKEETALKGCATNFDDGLIQFVYDQSKGFGQPAVTNPDNWAYDEQSEAECGPLDDVVACAIRVSPEYLNSMTSKLESTINLVASPHLSGSYYISDSSDDNMVPLNAESPQL